MSGGSRRGRSQRPPNPSRVHPIKPDDPPIQGLPCDVDAERFVIGAVLLDDSRFEEVGQLAVDDFSVERHRRVYRAMRDLRDLGEGIDRITVANRLRERNEGSDDDFSFLVDLDTGIPQVPHLTSWLRILRKKSVLRRAMLESHKFTVDCSLRVTEPNELLAGYQARIEALNTEWVLAEGGISRIEDLESVFADQSPAEYVIYPVLPAKALITLAGDSESGKTTLACAWARDAILQGHAVLILDRDRNPRERIRDRLTRLGVSADSKLLHVWDCEQKSEPPQPNDPRVVAWVKRMVAETGKSPLVIGDSLISFLMGEEDENSATDMRALFDRFRVLNGAGATVIIAHHTNRSGEARGSSDFKPAGDQGFLVSNHDRAGGRLLDVITLKYEKSRFGFSGKIVCHYADGKMICASGGAPKEQPRQAPSERLKSLLIDNPGVLSDQFVRLAQEVGLTRETARDFLKEGESTGAIRVDVQGRARLHFWRPEQTDNGDLGAN